MTEQARWADVPLWFWMGAGDENAYRFGNPVDIDPRIFREHHWPAEDPTYIMCDYRDYGKPVEPNEIACVSTGSRLKILPGYAAKLSNRTHLMGICTIHWVTPIYHDDGNLNYTQEQRATRLRASKAESAV